MVRLANRQHNIPGGFQFYQAETNFEAPRHVSFNTVVDAVIRHRRGNKWLADKHSWATDFETVADEVDAANALRMKANAAWSGFIIEDESGGSSLQAPFRFPKHHAGRVGAVGASRVVAGVKTLLAWLGAGGKPVAKELAEKRAATCSVCPLNEQGSLSTWFTEAAAAEVLKVAGMMSEMRLSTSHDDKLGLCKACGCVNKTKVWVPLNHVLAEMSPEVKEKLNKADPVCWVLQESA